MLKFSRFTVAELLPLRSLSRGKCCDLKIERGHYRVWLCRVHGGVTYELRAKGGRWYTCQGGCSPQPDTPAPVSHEGLPVC